MGPMGPTGPAGMPQASPQQQIQYLKTTLENMKRESDQSENVIKVLNARYGAEIRMAEFFEPEKVFTATGLDMTPHDPRPEYYRAAADCTMLGITAETVKLSQFQQGIEQLEEALRIVQSGIIVPSMRFNGPGSRQ